ncbi:MAG: hypothetical protein JSU90_10785 [Nitrospiraceae bacterium]|nr:MAG: hypothetical protein JSU90_10785 [Nitrospiraceae bacterium]
MMHGHSRKAHHKKSPGGSELIKFQEKSGVETAAQKAAPKLEFVLKCDSSGSLEAVSESIAKLPSASVEIAIIHSGIGAINKSDILIAETGSRMIAGFQVDVLPGIEQELREHAVEARLYRVIYTLTTDIRDMAERLVPSAPAEEILGTARVIALFKSSRRGIIIGCEVTEGSLTLGSRFRVISAMGPVYTGRIESMHRETSAVQKALPGHQVGIKIRDFSRVKTGDLVESFRPSPVKTAPPWKPGGKIIRVS